MPYHKAVKTTCPALQRPHDEPGCVDDEAEVDRRPRRRLWPCRPQRARDPGPAGLRESDRGIRLYPRAVHRQQLHVRQRPPGHVRGPGAFRRTSGRNRDGGGGGRNACRTRSVRGSVGRNHVEEMDVVVLQEQSEIPSVEQFRQSEMYPAARRLADTIYRHGSRPMFFLTWAHRDGWPENGLPNYVSMQSAIDDGYLAIAAEEQAAVAPVGVAWSTVRNQPHPGLWQDDGSHPTAAGTYLAACVFYATIFHQSPRGLTYRADLSPVDAAMLQTIAADTVLSDPRKWLG